MTTTVDATMTTEGVTAAQISSINTSITSLNSSVSTLNTTLNTTVSGNTGSIQVTWE